MNDESGALPPRPVADDYRTRDGYISLSFHDAMRAWRQAADALMKVQQEAGATEGGRAMRRDPYTRHLGTDVDALGMNLPEGMTCGQCVHLRRCEAIYGRMPTDEVCDWLPSRFVRVKEVGR